MAKLNERRWGAKVGEDGGCFESALAAVRKWGGVLEHPANSLAWPRFGLLRPVSGAWQRAREQREWVCEVWQSAYGHKARKRTWLLYVGSAPKPLRWNRPRGTHLIGGGINTGNRTLPRLDDRETHITPMLFAEALVDLVRG